MPGEAAAAGRPESGGVACALLRLRGAGSVQGGKAGDGPRRTQGYVPPALMQTASALLKENGAAGFFRGWSWRTGRMICAIFILGRCKEALAPIFFPKHFVEE